MSDDKSKRNSPDSKRISLKEKWEVTYWTNKFGITLLQLRTAIEECETDSAEVVGEYLEGLYGKELGEEE